MPNYKESTVAGDVYTRCKSVLLSNPRGGNPTLSFIEELFYNIPGNEFGKDSGAFTVQFDPSATIPLLNPHTDQPLGKTATQADLHVLLYSLYIQQAKARDVRVENGQGAA